MHGFVQQPRKARYEHREYEELEKQRVPNPVFVVRMVVSKSISSDLLSLIRFLDVPKALF